MIPAYRGRLPEAVAAELTCLCARQGVDLPELANRSNLPEPWLREALFGNRELSLDHVDRLCQALGISLVDFARAVDERLGR